MDFVRRNLITELEPDSVEKVNLLWRQMRRVWAKVKDLILTGREIEL